MLVLNLTGRLIIGIDNVVDPPVFEGHFDISSNSELAFAGFANQLIIQIGAFNIVGDSALSFIGTVTPVNPEIGAFDILGNSELAFIGEANQLIIINSAFNIFGDSVLAFIGQFSTSPNHVNGLFNILGNSILAFQGENSAQAVTGSFSIFGTSTLAFIGVAAPGGTTVVEGSFSITSQSSIFFQIFNGASGGEQPNDFFDQQVARPECIASYPLRSQANIDLVGGTDGAWTYVWGTPEEDYPDPQNAAKLIMSHSLAGSQQLHFPLNAFGINSGNLLIICDIWLGIEFRTNVLALEHKFFNLMDRGPSNAGAQIYCEPRTLYRPNTNPDPVVALLDLRSYSLLGSNTVPSAWPEGLIRQTPWQPTGLGAQASGTYKMNRSVWSRYWIYLELFQTEFTEWSNIYNSGNPVGRSTIVSTTPGNPTIVQHAGNRNFAIQDTAGVGTRVLISGNSIGSVNGTHQATIIDTTHFSIPVNTVAAGAGGVIQQYFHRLTILFADETRNAVRLIYKVPYGIRASGELVRFMYEMNTSNKVTTAVRGASIPSSPSIGNPTIITTAVPHGLVDDEWVRIHGNNVIPNQTQGRVTVINSTSFSFPFNMTTPSVPAASGTFVGTHGYVAKQLIGYGKNVIFLRNITLNEADSSLVRKPIG